MSQNIPAWKRIGLKVKKELETDPLALSSHLESSNLTKKDIKHINKQKRKAEDSAKEKSKKPPKRVKLPKSEKPPPPEKDQLVYLRQYHKDKDNWKFSKQKQNWILKNIRNIPGEYEEALSVYLEGLQGGSRTRIVDSLKAVIEKWNVLAAEAEAKVEKELEEKLLGKKAEEENEKKGEEKNEEKKKETEKEEDAVDLEYALRCRNLVFVLTDEKVPLKGAGDEDEAEIEEEKEKAEEKDDAQDDSLSNLIIDEVDVEGTEDPVQEQSSKKKKKSKNKKSKK